MDDADEVGSFTTAGGVLMVRGAYGLANLVFAPGLENRTLGFDLDRPPPHTKRKNSGTCKLCDSKAREEGACARSAKERTKQGKKHEFLSLQGKRCCSWIHLFEKDLVDGSGQETKLLNSLLRPMPLPKTQCKRPMPLLHQPMYY